MELMWCGEDFCKDAIRERVVGDNNQVMLNGPATGQVAYAWWKDNDGDDEIEETLLQAVASILFLVRPGDDDLMRIAADTVRELEDDPLHILLDPSTAARLKHYHGVDQDNICLFEPQSTPGFGSNLRPSEVSSSIPYPWKTNPSVANPPHGEHDAFPDLICTIGGDGLLMHAAMLFQGPIPPILAVAGGSLGFLTPFSKEEMVDAIRVSLGMLQLDGATATKNSALVQAGDTKVFPPNMPSYPYEPLLRHPQLRCFGYDSRICLSIRMRLECRILNGQGAVRARYNVLNEVVIDRGSSPYLAALECFCDDVHLTTVQADGIIFATPTGSTAYSMAAGGSVVHPAVPAILVTPICPHVLSFRSMVFPDHVVLRCYVPDDARAEASVAFDGKHRQELHRGDSVQIQMSAYPVPTINRMDHSSDWLGSLKQNFNFNTRPRQRPL
jgi:NAD+ kinase